MVTHTLCLSIISIHNYSTAPDLAIIPQLGNFFMPSLLSWRLCIKYRATESFVEEKLALASNFKHHYKMLFMADDKNLRDGRDRSRVSGSEEYELQHIAEQLNVSREEVRRAIEQVGNSREKIEEHLRKNRKQ
jgi:hypothetical protein